MASGIFDPQMIELFYQAALEPDYWPQALAGLLPAYRSKHVSFYTAPVLENRAAMFAQHGFTEAELKIQFSPEAMQNWESWRAMSPVARTFTNRHLMSAAEWERSKAYNEFVKHSGVYHGAILQQMTPDTSFYFALCRPNPADPYTDEELTSLQSALSHLTYALRLQTRLRLAEQRTHVLRAALDGIGEGALIVDAKGRAGDRQCPRASPSRSRRWDSRSLDGAARGTARVHASAFECNRGSGRSVEQWLAENPPSTPPLTLSPPA